MEIGIQFKSNTSYVDKYSILPVINGREDESITDTVMIIYTPLMDYDEVCEILLNFPFIEKIEQSFIRTNLFVSSDPLLSTQWHLGAFPGINAIDTWARNITGEGVYIVNTDTGCFLHDDLIDNFGIIPNETKVGRVDSNFNGYKNDYYGWNFYAANNVLCNNVALDDNLHGTQTSGVMVAKNNTIGIAGVAPYAKVINTVIFDNRGKYVDSFAAAKAINYAISLKNSGLNIVAINLSWGGLGYSFVEAAAIAQANSSEILCICAAGNSATNTDNIPHYPSGLPYDNIISVGATDRFSNIASYSNYGSTTVDLFAPGSSINTTSAIRQGIDSASSYKSVNGTSFAAPIVSGAIALYRSKYPNKTAAQTKFEIMGAVTVTDTFSGKCVSGGSLNISAAYW